MCTAQYLLAFFGACCDAVICKFIYIRIGVGQYDGIFPFGPDAKHIGLDLIAPMLKFATCAFRYCKSVRMQIVEARGDALEAAIEASHTWEDVFE